MENHIKFLRGKQKELLLKIQTKSRLSTDKLAKLSGVVGRSYRDWKNEKLNMSFNAALLLSNKFKVKLPEDINSARERWIRYKSKIGIKGGIACYKKYGNLGTPEGRKKGGQKAIKTLWAKGIFSPPKIYILPKSHSTDLAEFFGILLGDGGITNEQICITLNSIADSNYVLYVNNLGEILFGEKPKSFKKKDCNAITLYWNGTMLVNYLVKEGLKTGNKVKQQVDVPNWIKENKKFRICCLRGLMDTDGGIFVHKYKVNNKLYLYKKICFSNRSLPLLKFVFIALKELGFNPKIILKVENKKVWLYNKDETEKYLEVVGSHNMRLLKYKNKESGQNGYARVR